MMIDPWHIFTAGFGTMPKPCTALVTLLELAFYLYLAMRVGAARNKYHVQAPNIDGPPVFMRTFRVHQNMMEQLAMHLPLLWIAAFAMDDVFAAAFGAVWLFGRVLYAVRYVAKPKRRLKGFFIALAANAVLFFCALASIIASL